MMVLVLGAQVSVFCQLYSHFPHQDDLFFADSHSERNTHTHREYDKQKREARATKATKKSLFTLLFIHPALMSPRPPLVTIDLFAVLSTNHSVSSSPLSILPRPFIPPRPGDAFCPFCCLSCPLCRLSIPAPSAASLFPSLLLTCPSRCSC